VPRPRFFMLGLAAFLLAHVCYIVGLNPTLPPLSSSGVLIVVAAFGAWLYRGIAAGLRSKGQLALRAPVAVYSAVLALLLFSAWATLFRPEWTPLRRGMVIVGATAFFVSDSMLAWGKFVRPLPGGRATSMMMYHLAQFMLAASIAAV
jgi:alkenylglycerophosphocholine hydrolase